MSNDRGNPRDPRGPGQNQGGRDYQGGQSRFAQRGLSHEERMHDDDSARRFPGQTGPGARATSHGGSYGSGGSYGYGGGFEHEGEGGYDDAPVRDPRNGRDEFYESTGGFGQDVSGYARHGLGHSGYGERRSGSPEPRAQAPSGAHLEGRVLPARVQPVRGRFYGRTPQGYTRSDERIREDVCDQLSYGQIDPSEVSVKVEQGVVTLEGFIGSRQDKFHAEEVADSVMGVKDVDNRLRLKRDQPAQSAVTPSADAAETPRSKNNTHGARS